MADWATYLGGAREYVKDLDAVMPSVTHGADRYENNTDPAGAIR